MTHEERCGPILVVDDDEAFLKFLTGLLTGNGHLVCATSSAEDAVRFVECERPELAIFDVCMPGLSGYELCRRLRDRYGDEVPVLFVSGERTAPVDRVAGLLLGGGDYVVKPFAPDELLARVASLLRRRAPGPARAPILTPREQEVFELLARGLANAEIARRLVISPKTVGTHIAHIYEKLGARSRVEALTAGYRHELLEALPE